MRRGRWARGPGAREASRAGWELWSLMEICQVATRIGSSAEMSSCSQVADLAAGHGLLSVRCGLRAQPGEVEVGWEMGTVMLSWMSCMGWG